MNLTDWQVVINKCQYVPVIATRSMIDYQNEYFHTPDSSRVLYENNQPIGVWPGVIGGVHQPPIFIAGASEKVQKKAVEELLYREKDGLTEAVDFFTGEFGISLWHQQLVKMGAKVEVKYDLYVDLSLSPREIRHKIRRSYQKLINQYKKDWPPFHCDNCNDKLIDQFMRFHELVSGRKTRSEETWKLQQKTVNAKEAFIVAFLANNSTSAISLFNYSKDECLYAVAVYDRVLTEVKGVPLGHLTIWEAIKHCQSLGIRWLKLGDWALDGNEKERAIGHFKVGFATHTIPRFEFKF
jgi:FemAB family protein